MTLDKQYIPAKTRRSPNAGLMLGQRQRQWANIKPALGERLVVAGMSAACCFRLANLLEIVVFFETMFAWCSLERVQLKNLNNNM